MFMLRGIVDAISKKTMNALQKPAFVTIVLAIILLTYTPCLVLGASSGGRMGGSSFRSSSSSSSSHARRPMEYSTHHHHHHHHHHDRDPAPASIDFIWIVVIGMCICFLVIGMVLMWVSQITSIIKLQVCLFGSVRSLQEDLDKIAECTDTSTPLGWNYILRKTTKALLRRQDSWFSAHSSVYVKSDTEDGKMLFEEISTEERDKFDDETLVNVKNFKWKGASKLTDGGIGDGYIVVTILVAAEGTHVFPYIECNKDLKTSLQNLSSIPTEDIRGVEVLWTPQEENDILPEHDFHESYPLLSRPFLQGMAQEKED